MDSNKSRRARSRSPAAADVLPNPLHQLTTYELRHVVTHAVEGGRDTEVHRLLALEWTPVPGSTRNALFEAFEEAGEPERFANDVRLAWRLAQAATDREVAMGEPAKGVGLEILYALTYASIATFVANVGPRLLEELVRAAVWSAAHAVAYARRIPVFLQRAEALVALLSQVEGEDRERLAREALTSWRAARGDWWNRQPVLHRLATRAPGSLHDELLAAASTIDNEDAQRKVVDALVGHASDLETKKARRKVHPKRTLSMLEYARSLDGEARVKALSELVPDLDGRGRRLLLEDVAALRSDRNRAILLTALARDADGELVSELQREADRLDGWERAEVLLALVPRLPVRRRDRVLRRIAKAAREPVGITTAHLLAELAPYLGARDRAATLDKAVSIGVAEAKRLHDSWNWRVSGLRDLASKLPPRGAEQVLSAALASARQSYDPDDATGELIEALPTGLSPEFLRDVLRRATTIGDGATRRSAEIAFAPGASARAREAVWSAVMRDIPRQEARGSYFRTGALTMALSLPRLAASHRNRLLARAIRAVRDPALDPHDRQSLFRWLAKTAPTAVLAELRLGRAQLGGVETWLIEAIAPHLPADALGDAVGAARKLTAGRLEALIALTPRLPTAQQRGVLKEIRSMKSDSALDALATLVPVLRGTARSRVASEVFIAMKRRHGGRPVLPRRRGSESCMLDGELLYRISPWLPAHHVTSAVKIARRLPVGELRLSVLTRLAPRLTGRRREVMLNTMIETMRQQSDFLGVSPENVAHLASHLEPRQADRLWVNVLDTVGRVMPRSKRLDLLADIVPRLSDGAVERALEVARAFNLPDLRAQAMRFVAPRLKEEARAVLVAEIAADCRQRRDGFRLADLAECMSDGAERDRALTDAMGFALAPLTVGSRSRVGLKGSKGETTTDRAALEAVQKRLTSGSRPAMLTALRRALEEFAPSGRREVLSRLNGFSPVVTTLGGEVACDHTLHAIETVVRWFP
jgi:hypothetical protein